MNPVKSNLQSAAAAIHLAQTLLEIALNTLTSNNHDPRWFHAIQSAADQTSQLYLHIGNIAGTFPLQDPREGPCHES